MISIDTLRNLGFKGERLEIDFSYYDDEEIVRMTIRDQPFDFWLGLTSGKLWNYGEYNAKNGVRIATSAFPEVRRNTLYICGDSFTGNVTAEDDLSRDEAYVQIERYKEAIAEFNLARGVVIPNPKSKTFFD